MLQSHYIQKPNLRQTIDCPGGARVKLSNVFYWHIYSKHLGNVMPLLSNAMTTWIY